MEAPGTLIWWHAHNLLKALSRQYLRLSFARNGETRGLILRVVRAESLVTPCRKWVTSSAKGKKMIRQKNLSWMTCFFSSEKISHREKAVFETLFRFYSNKSFRVVRRLYRVVLLNGEYILFFFESSVPETFSDENFSRTCFDVSSVLQRNTRCVYVWN